MANIFRKQNSLSDDSRGTSTQTMINNIESDKEKSVSTNSKRDSVHSNWSELLSVNEETGDERAYRSEPVTGVATTSYGWRNHEEAFHPSTEKDSKNIVLIPYKLKPKDWGNWRIKLPYATSNNTSPNMVCTKE